VVLDEGAVERAVATAQAVCGQLRKTSSFDRAQVLDKVATGLAADKLMIAQAISSESGYLSVSDMELEVHRAIEAFTLTAAYVRTGMSELLNLDAVERARGAIGIVRREPIGPILGITAFNGPLLIAAHKVAPAIAAGAPIILKPSPRIPKAAIVFAQLVIAAGWPAEAIAVLDVDDATTMRLIRDERLPVISFTGGDFGWKIRQEVPRKRVHLELGGVGCAHSCGRRLGPGRKRVRRGWICTFWAVLHFGSENLRRTRCLRLLCPSIRG